jgi:hypothetical protein
MSAPTDQITDFAKRSQDAVTTVVRNWTDAVQSFSGNQAALPDAHALVNTYFDFAEKALSAQREAAQQAVTVTVKAAEALKEQAAKVTAQV